MPIRNGFLRLAATDDAAEICRIYEYYVDQTPITFETAMPSTEEIAGRISKNLHLASWLVYEAEDKVVGYAYGSKHRARDAYRWSADVAIYIDAPYHRKGVATVLYQDLFVRLAERGYYNAFAGITLPNVSSVAFHEAMGFTLVGIYKDVGFKMGAWHDVGWWQKRLRGIDTPPALTPPSEPGEGSD